MGDSSIISVQTFVVRLGDGAREYRVAANRSTIYAVVPETLMVRIETTGGAVGWGECLAPVAARVPAAIIDDLLTPVLLGADAQQVRPLHRRLSGLMRERGHLGGHQADALAAVDIALWDLAGRLAGVPVVQLLGGAFRTQIPTYLTHVAGADAATRAHSAATAVAAGAARLKLHLGNGIGDDLESFDAVTAAAPGIPVAIDTHCVYDLASALRLGTALDQRGAWFFESPLAPEDIAGHSELAANLTTPVAVGEAFRHRFEVRDWIDRRGLDILQPDIGRTGISEGTVITTLAEAAHLPVIPHHSAAFGLALVAGLHVAAATENAPAFEYSPNAVGAANRLLTTPLDPDPDSMALPDGPGLGVEVDEPLIRELASSP